MSGNHECHGRWNPQSAVSQARPRAGTRGRRRTDAVPLDRVDRVARHEGVVEADGVADERARPDRERLAWLPGTPA
jgi:hypothetical protein